MLNHYRNPLGSILSRLFCGKGIPPALLSGPDSVREERAWYFSTIISVGIESSMLDRAGELFSKYHKIQLCNVFVEKDLNGI